MNEESQIVATEAYTVQDASPARVHQTTRFTSMALLFPFLFMIIWLAILTFIIVMMWKFVKAHERIATKLEEGITIKKDNISL